MADSFVADTFTPDAEAAPVGAITPAAPAHPWVATNEAARSPEGQQKTADDLRRMVRLVGQSERPQSFDDAALVALGAAPLIKQGGAIAKAAIPAWPMIAPALARVATAIGLAKTRGEDTPTAVLEGAGAGMAEGAGALAAKTLVVPAAAMDAIRARISRGPDGPLNVRLVDTLLDWWKADPNKAVQAQRATAVVRNLLELDPSREAARIFREQVAKGVKIPLTHTTLPPVSPEFSQAARAVASSPGVQSAADAAMSADPLAPVLPLMGAQAMNPMHRLQGLMK